MGGNEDAPWEINPRDIEKTIAADKYDDCLACRATGSLALVGLGGWSYYNGMKNLRIQEQKILQSGSKYRMGSRKMGLFFISASLVGMGVWRAVH